MEGAVWAVAEMIGGATRHTTALRPAATASTMSTVSTVMVMVMVMVPC